MPSPLQIITGTPYWVWVLFAYLLLIGVRALKKRRAPLYRFGIMPAIFILWSLSSLFSKPTSLTVIWAALVLMGSLTSYHLASRLRITADKTSGLIEIPGSIIPLVLSCSFFSIKYILGVSFALDPLLKTNLLISGFDAAVSGLISGISVGRFFRILSRYRMR